MELREEAPDRELGERVAVRVETAAWMYDVGRSTLYEQILSGALPSIKVGRSRRILLDDLRAWFESQRDAA